MYFHFGSIGGTSSSSYYCPDSSSLGTSLGSHVVVTVEEDVANNRNTLTW
jgi:hypothetical protein